MLSVAVEESKNQLRSAALKRRAAADPANCRYWGRLIQARVLDSPMYRAAAVMAAYQPIGKEVDTRLVMDHALQQGKQVFVPCLEREDDVFFRRIFSGEESPNERGPVVDPVSAGRLARYSDSGLLVLVPAVLFDRRGHRLGRGGGWYDRVLQVLNGRATCLGLGYEFQLVCRVPAQPWDQRVHFVVTESGMMDCSMQPFPPAR
jgi:5-formyltetrahydrofolate cyclo-ligase